jgi:DNA-binding transcriptional regulator/RsmH inhibitor MraZ
MKKLSEYTNKEKEKMTHIEMGQITRKYLDSQKRIIMARLINNFKLEQEVAKNVVGL